MYRLFCSLSLCYWIQYFHAENDIVWFKVVIIPFDIQRFETSNLIAGENTPPQSFNFTSIELMALIKKWIEFWFLCGIQEVRTRAWFKRKLEGLCACDKNWSIIFWTICYLLYCLESNDLIKFGGWKIPRFFSQKSNVRL